MPIPTSLHQPRQAQLPKYAAQPFAGLDIESAYLQGQAPILLETTTLITDRRIAAAFEQEARHRCGARDPKTSPAIHVQRVHVRSCIQQQPYKVEGIGAPGAEESGFSGGGEVRLRVA